jgi:hypothetical protein
MFELSHGKNFRLRNVTWTADAMCLRFQKKLSGAEILGWLNQVLVLLQIPSEEGGGRDGGDRHHEHHLPHPVLLRSGPA